MTTHATTTGLGLFAPTADVPRITDAGSAQLVVAALVGITVIVLLITVLKLHPFLSLTIGSLVVGVVAGANIAKTIESFTLGFGSRFRRSRASS
jgi:GntP family gluconate:H+ symporter